MESTGGATWLTVFDRLFDKAAHKLNLECTAEEKEEAKRHFADRFQDAMNTLENEGIDGASGAVMAQMEEAIDELRPAQVAGYLAAGPLAQQFHHSLQTIALRTARERLIEHYISQADDTYGGN